MYEKESLGELQRLTSTIEAAASILDDCLVSWLAMSLIAEDTLKHVSLLNKLRLCDACIAQLAEPAAFRALEDAIKRTADSQVAWDKAIRARVERALVQATESDYDLRTLSIALVRAISDLTETILTAARV